MTDLREVVDVRGPGLRAEFVCEAIVGSEVLDAVRLSEAEILRQTAAAVEFEVGMAEIHTDSAAGLDHVVFPLCRGTLAQAWLDQTPEPRVVVWLA